MSVEAFRVVGCCRALGLRAQGLGFGVLGLRVQGLWPSLGFGVWCLGFRVLGIWGLGSCDVPLGLGC